MVRINAWLLAVGAFVCLSPTSADAQGGSKNCKVITSANSDVCCKVITPDNVNRCERRPRSTSRGWEFGTFFRSGPGGPGGGGGGGGSSAGLNPAGHPSQGGGYGITAPNGGGAGPGGGGATGNPGLGGYGPPGHSK